MSKKTNQKAHGVEDQIIAREDRADNLSRTQQKKTPGSHPGVIAGQAAKELNRHVKS